MASPFDTLAGVADAAALGVFGEEWRVHPVTAPPNGRPVADSSRQSFVVVGIRRRFQKRAGFSDQRQAMESGKGVGMAGGESGVGVSRAACPWKPRPGDILERVSGGQKSRVIRAEDYGHDGYDIIIGMAPA